MRLVLRYGLPVLWDWALRRRAADMTSEAHIPTPNPLALPKRL